MHLWGLPITAHLWRRFGGSVTVGGATARFSGRKSVFTYRLPLAFFLGELREVNDGECDKGR